MTAGARHLTAAVAAAGLVAAGCRDTPTATADDDQWPAYAGATGRELWHAPLPFADIATRMSYQAGGRQFVVIAAGGHGNANLPIGDAVVACALPR
jgi:glucose dehydrogenase